jgi:peroxiredoxin
VTPSPFRLRISTLSRFAILGLFSLAAAAWSAGARGEPKAADTTVPDLTRTAMFLIRESAVRKELKLDSRQWRSIEAALTEVDGPLWALRDAPVEKSALPAAQLRAAFQKQLDAALEPEQKERLDQLVLQALSLASLAAPSMADQLDLTAEQRERIRSALDETQRAASEAQTAAAKQPAKGAAAGEKLRAAGRKRVLDVLSEEQRERFIGLLGRPFPVARVRQAYAQAPELKDLDGWINSPPLALADQRGKVVVLNFWAFGCINCVRNLPWYKGWHEKFADRGVVVLGVHTPETQAERNPDSLRKKVKEDGILYPVAIDTRAQTWAAWANNMWPSTYLIDKRGYVRYWWYGELNWQGAEGEKFMRAKIEELLAEKD